MEEQQKVEVSSNLISAATDSVLEDVSTGASRKLAFMND
jgi:hypothetical protein